MWQALAAAAAGGIAGGQKDKQQTVQGFGNTSGLILRDFKDITKGAGDLENNVYAGQVSQFADLLKLVQGGPGQQEITDNNQYQNTFGNLLNNLLGQVYSPTKAQTQENMGKARDLFSVDQTLLNQRFQDQETEGRRMSAQLGRAGNDPILRNKMMQERTRQQQQLDSQVTSYARQLPEITANNVMSVGGALSNLKSNLAAQAMSNRQMLLQMGDVLKNSERNFRMGTATRENQGSTDTSVYSGGGFKGAMSGAIEGGGAMMGGMGK